MNSRRSSSIRASLSVLTACVALCATVLAAPAASVAGDWQGTLTAGGRAMRVVIHIVAEKDAFTATMDSPDQGVAGIEVTSVTFTGRALHFEVPKISGSFDGKADEDLSAIAGHWKQGPASLPLTLKRIGK